MALHSCFSVTAAGADARHWHAGAVAAPTAINIAPAAIAVGATGVDADPSLISVGCDPRPPWRLLSLRCAACMHVVFPVWRAAQHAWGSML